METLTTSAEETRYAELQLLALDYARAGETAPLGAMLRAGLPVNLQDLKGNTLLMLAAYHGQSAMVAALLKHGAEPDRRNLRHQTPLGGVAFKGHVEIAALLLDAGADREADQGNGATPLMLATLFGRTEMVELLRERGSRMRPHWRFAAGVVRPLVRLFSFFRRAGSRENQRRTPLRKSDQV